MGFLNNVCMKIRMLHWLYRHAARRNLSFDCGSDLVWEAISKERLNSFHDIAAAELQEKKQALTAGQDAAFCENVDDFLSQIAFWYELKKFEHIISLVPPEGSAENELYQAFQELMKEKFPFSELGVAALHLHHGLRFAGEKIRNYVRNGVFIDAGAWEGDSASVFLQHYSPSKVYSFEISGINAAKYRRNMKSLGFPPERYELELLALGAERDTLTFCDDGSDGCSVLSSGTAQIEVLPLDDFMRTRQGPVRFIKADVEGFALEMMKGAVELLKRDRPVLSLSIYHNPDEFFGLKPFLEALNLNYRFELQKHSPFRDTLEFVLFACPAELEEK